MSFPLKIPEQIIQCNCIYKITEVLNMSQAECCNQCIMYRNPFRKYFPKQPFFSDKKKMTFPVSNELITVKFDLAHINYVVFPLDDKINLGAFGIIRAFFRP